MNGMKTLHELCDALGVSRRAVQGYEKAGLVAPSGRNKYGHLLYDEKAQNRIAQIRLYQQLGFRIKDIKELLDAPDMVVRQMLEKQVMYLKEERTKTEKLIAIACVLIDGSGTDADQNDADQT